MDLSQLQLPNLIDQLSGLSTTIILAAAGLHLIWFFWLSAWSTSDLRNIAIALDEFTRDLRHRSILTKKSHLSDQIDAFITDVNEVLVDSSRVDERKSCLMRMNILDERRKYLDSSSFDTAYNICRTMIEAYPLAGVLGTILAIGAALQTGPAGEGATTVAAIVSRFGDAIWSTFAGLISAIVLMFVNSMVETRFERLTDNRSHVRDMVARAKRELSMTLESDS